MLEVTVTKENLILHCCCLYFCQLLLVLYLYVIKLIQFIFQPGNCISYLDIYKLNLFVVIAFTFHSLFDKCLVSRVFYGHHIGALF